MTESDCSQARPTAVTPTFPPLSPRRKLLVYLAFFLSVALLLSLGGWQWRRGVDKTASEKLRAEKHYSTLAQAPPDWSALAYRRVRLEGRWRHQHFLLANRIQHGRLGYEVLSAFQLEDGTTLLVNRGWLPQSGENGSIPQVDFPNASARHAAVSGWLHPVQKGFTLGAAYTPQRGWPKVIQHFDAAALAALLATPVPPAVVILQPHHPVAFAEIARPAGLTAARHFGYAVQWWGLACTLLVFGIIWRRNPSTRPSR